METYLFVTVPNNSGSKVIVGVLQGCKNIIYLPREGERYVNIPAAKSRIWTQTTQRAEMEDESNYNFVHMKNEWMKLWRTCKHFPIAKSKIFMEKSPPNVLRAQMYEKHFKESHFLIMVRNPYATIEGILRRHPGDIKSAVNHWIATTEKQIENISGLEKNVYFTYEELCDKPKETKQKLVAFLPALADIDMRRKVTMPAKVIKKVGNSIMPPTNLNEKQIKNLSKIQIEEINNYLSKHKNLLDFFGYKIIEG